MAMGWARRARTGATVALAAAIAGCGGGPQSALDPHSKPAQQIADLWWAMLGAACVVLGGTVLFLVWGFLRRRKEGLPIVGNREPVNQLVVVVFGIVIPIAVLVAVFAAANLSVIKTTQAPAQASTRMTLDVVGRQWFWEARYPGSPAVVANEIHIPARTRVDLVATTSDVIHSFWVPELNRKIDMIPGHPNRILLYADQPGTYRGQCAEFCGLQHAHMALKVVADPPARFRAWLRAQSAPGAAPRTPAQQAGQRAFLADQCASCHTIRGTAAAGRVGPDLTHLASRTTLAALTIPNRPGELADWIVDPQHVKPGAKMPGLDLSGRDVQDLVSYLESLR